MLWLKRLGRSTGGLRVPGAELFRDEHGTVELRHTGKEFMAAGLET